MRLAFASGMYTYHVYMYHTPWLHPAQASSDSGSESSSGSEDQALWDKAPVVTVCHVQKKTNFSTALRPIHWELTPTRLHCKSCRLQGLSRKAVRARLQSQQTRLLLILNRLRTLRHIRWCHMKTQCHMQTQIPSLQLTAR